jgi:hypothetical protein
MISNISEINWRQIVINNSGADRASEYSISSSSWLERDTRRRGAFSFIEIQMCLLCMTVLHALTSLLY